MLTDSEENLHTLMVLTGMSEEGAATLLGHRVRIRASTEGDFQKLANDIRRVLERTLPVVAEHEPWDIELAVGIAPTTTSDRSLCLTLSGEAMHISPGGDYETLPSRRSEIAGITRRGCACFAAGFVLSRLLGDSSPQAPDSTFELKFANLGFPVDEITEPLDLKDSVLAGGGGVANGFLWAIEELRPIGKLAIVDPKRARSGNSNRCLYFRREDDEYKAKLLVERVNLPGVQVESFTGTLMQYRNSRPDKRIPWLISTADSRVVRRSFQNELPMAVFDASTTDVSEVVIHSHEQPTAEACLSCIYSHIADEDHRDKHIAETLGLTLDDVRSKLIDEGIAARLVERFPQFQKNALVGIAFDSLHKELCGQQKLLTPAAQQAAAPFSFVSNLAGVLLALEMYRHQADFKNWGKTNYMALSPWMPPHSRLRRLRGRLPNCEACSDTKYREALNAVWSDMEWSKYHRDRQNHIDV